MSQTDGQLKSVSLFQLWEIENFISDAKHMRKNLISPTFVAIHSNRTIEWRIILYPRGEEDINQDYMSIFLLCVEKVDFPVQVSFSLLDCGNNKVSGAIAEEKGANTIWIERFVRRTFVMDERNNVITDDKLRILCEITFNRQISVVENQNEHEDRNMKVAVLEKKIQTLRKRLQEFEDFKELFDNEHCSDVTFVIGDKKIKLHKAILISRCPLFKKLFETNPTREEFTITDIPYKILWEFLKFLYVGEVTSINESADELLSAAERCSILGLKNLCEETLCDSLTDENILDRLCLAVKCKAERLKNQAIEYIASRPKDIIDKMEFEKLADEYPNTTCELIRAIAERNS